MPYSFYWQDEKHTIARIDVHSDVTWQQWHANVNKLAQELAAGEDRRIDVIVNDAVGMPSGNLGLHIVKTAKQLQRYPNLGTIVAVNHGNVRPLTKVYVEMTLRANGMRMRHYGGVVPNLKEALNVIGVSRANAVISI